QEVFLAWALAMPLAAVFLSRGTQRVLLGGVGIGVVILLVMDLLQVPQLVKSPITARRPAGDAVPNVAIVIWDAARRDHRAAPGYSRETTPALEALAHDGVTYRNAYSPATWTLPSHASLFSGQYPSTHGVTDEHPDIGPNVPLLAAALAAGGYETGAFVANPW